MSRVSPTKPAKLDRFGLRLDSIESHVAAFYARTQGATGAEIQRELGCSLAGIIRVVRKLLSKGYRFRLGGRGWPEKDDQP